MKEIDYFYKANWYEEEIEKIDLTSFLYFIHDSLNVRSLKVIPCDVANNIIQYSNIFDFVVFSDLCTEMIKIVNHKIKEFSIKNSIAKIENIKESYCDEVDLLYIPRHAIHFLKIEEIETFLKNFKTSKIKYLIIEIFNFENSDNEHPWYFKNHKNFKYLKKSINKISLIENHSEFVNVHNTYIFENIELESNITYWKIDFITLIKIIKQYNLQILYQFSNYCLETNCKNNIILIIGKN